MVAVVVVDIQESKMRGKAKIKSGEPNSVNIGDYGHVHLNVIPDPDKDTGDDIHAHSTLIITSSSVDSDFLAFPFIVRPRHPELLGQATSTQVL